MEAENLPSKIQEDFLTEKKSQYNKTWNLHLSSEFAWWD